MTTLFGQRYRTEVLKDNCIICDKKLIDVFYPDREGRYFRCSNHSFSVKFVKDHVDIFNSYYEIAIPYSNIKMLITKHFNTNYMDIVCEKFLIHKFLDCEYRFKLSDKRFQEQFELLADKASKIKKETCECPYCHSDMINEKCEHSNSIKFHSIAVDNKDKCVFSINIDNYYCKFIASKTENVISGAIIENGLAVKRLDFTISKPILKMNEEEIYSEIQQCLLFS